jgi:hypothetical protein
MLYDPAVVIQNYPPAFTSTPETYAEAGSLYTYAAQASDEDEDPLTFSAVIKPGWLAIDAGSGLLSGTPLADDIGVHPVALRVSDGMFGSYQSFTLIVGAVGNDAPVFTSLPTTGVLENKTYSYTCSAVDYDGDLLAYSVLTKPAWLSFNTTTCVLSGSPTSAHIGLHPVALAVSDGSITVTQQFNVAVFDTPIPNNSVQNGSFELGTTTPTSWTIGTNTTRSIEDSQDGLAALKLITAPGNNSQTVTLQTRTDYTLSVWVNADSMTAGGIRFDTNDKFDGTTNGLGGNCQFNIDFETKPSGWTQFTGTFNSSNETSVTLRTYKKPTVGMTGTVYFDNVVLAPANASNNAPVITSVPITNAVEGSMYRYNLLAADAENSPMVFTGLSIPSWLSFNADSGLLSGTPDGTDTGSHSVSLRASDGSFSVTQNFTIAVAAYIPPVSGYAVWASTNGVGGAIEDEDNDGRNNLYEYALNGNPNSSADPGTDPTFTKAAAGFEYNHLQRKGDPDLIYVVETVTNLVSGVWTNAGVSILQTNPVSGIFEEVVTGIPATNLTTYIRLKIIHVQ